MSAARKISSKKEKSLGDLLVQENIISKNELISIQNLKNENREQMLTLLLKGGYVSESELMNFLSEQYGCQIIQLEDFEISKELTKIVSKKTCERYTVVPVSKIADTLVVACANPADKIAKEQLMFFTGCRIEFVLSSMSVIKKTIESVYEESTFDIYKLFSEIEFSTSKLREDYSEEDHLGIIKIDKRDKEPIIRCVNRIITSAVSKKASDIHIESYEKKCRIRFRVDGKLHEIFYPPKTVAPFIVSRIKVISKMDIGEKRKPQDARLKVSLDGGKEISFRVSSVPTVGGEKLVLRILDNLFVSDNFADLGMDDHEISLFKRALGLPQGLILITGPTGSGKTTTIYSGLSVLNTSFRNISTAEDPVEYKIEGLNQVQMHSKIGLDFAMTLRTFLRQDPDVILVGEIRDRETAEVAFKASATGHLVVSTLHTNDTTSTITRLLDMGIPDYSIAENTSLIIGQRLLRKICSHCLAKDDVSVSSMKMIGIPKHLIKEAKDRLKCGKGCRKCLNSGYKGRSAVYEMLTITDKIREGVFKKLSPSELKKQAIQDGELKTIRRSGIEKMLEGITSFEEVFYGTKGDN